MKRYVKSIRQWFLTLATIFFLAVAFPGCSDPVVSDMEAQNQEFEFLIEQELQRSRNAFKVESGPVSRPPAQVVDMEAERRELDGRIERGDWQSLFN